MSTQNRRRTTPGLKQFVTCSQYFHFFVHDNAEWKKTQEKCTGNWRQLATQWSFHSVVLRDLLIRIMFRTSNIKKNSICYKRYGSINKTLIIIISKFNCNTL